MRGMKFVVQRSELRDHDDQVNLSGFGFKPFAVE